MKRAMLVVLGAGLAAAWFLHQPATEPANPVSSANPGDSTTPGLTLVSLHVPNMT